MLVELTDIRLNVIDEGAGQPVVFLHGLGANHRIWTRQLDAFHGEVRCIAPDLRGSGQSDQPPGPYSARLFADDVVQACERLGVGQAVVVGQSMGGMVAQALAVHHPGFVQAQVIVGSSLEGRYGQSLPPLAPDHPRGSKAVLLEEGLPALFAEVRDAIYPKAIQEEHPELVWHFERELYAFDVEAFIAALEREIDTDYGAELPKLRLPTLIIAGRHDGVCPPEESEHLAELIQGSELVVAEHCGHQPFYEDPEWFNGKLREFLARADVTERSPALSSRGGGR